MKRLIAIGSILMILAVILAGCGMKTQETPDTSSAETGTVSVHKIGVATYNIYDAQVMMFREYLDNYIGTAFADVEFLYSDSISNDAEMTEFLQWCADEGCEGIMAFNSYDLVREVEFCTENSMYFIRPSSTSSDAEFNAVADDPWFLGEIGPGSELETQACTNMVHSMAAKDDGQNYIILSGGAFMGVEMHRIRTAAMLNTLAEVYGFEYSAPVEEMALVSEPSEFIAGNTSILICPGFVEIPQYGDPVSDAIRSGKYSAILSTISVTPLMDALSDADIRCGVTDCFSEDNFFGFKKGKIAFVAGKYQSEIGPAFAVLYNAITGHSDIYRSEGKAFRLVQGFWTADNNASYDSMYALSCGISINAYDCEDIYSVIKIYNEDADFDTFKKLVESYSYEAAIARRSL